MRVRSLILACVILLIVGCDNTRQQPETLADAASVAREQSWTDQLAAVRAGQRAEIRVTTAAVTGDEWHQLSTGCAALEVLDVETLSANDESLAPLTHLPRLRQLRIGWPVGDAGLREIAAITTLRVLNLPRGEFTDAALGELTSLSDLELLRFRSSHVTDEGMKHIARLPSLRFLHLIDVPITDAGLASLEGFDQLESLYLDGCRCTDEGLSHLLESLPDLHLHRDQLHLPGDPHAHED